jgi:hypothetical protein
VYFKICTILEAVSQLVDIAMTRSLLRLLFTMLLGAAVTPLAGYIGSLAFPGLIVAWSLSLLASIFVGLKVTAALLIVPGIFGAQFAWPVTCVLFPLVGIRWRPATASATFVFSAIGALFGGLSTYVRIASGSLFVNPRDQFEFLAASLIAGAVLGGVFGYSLWRFDRMYPVRSAEANA